MPAKKNTILIVDDSKTILRTANQFLEDEYIIETADDGFQAMALLDACIGNNICRQPKQKKPDLVLLDIMMPKMDGYQVCQVLKSISAINDVPIIMLSSKDSPFDRARGDMVGCDGYITKPFDKSVLMEKIPQWIKKAKKNKN